MRERGSRLSEEQARALWQRAAELQADAEERESGNRTLARAAETGEPTLSLEQVAAAAEGAGIGGEYLRLALAEQRLPDAEALDPEMWTSRWLERLMASPLAVEAARVIAADPELVFRIFRDVAESERFGLVTEDIVGSDPLSDAVVVYRATGGEMASSLFMADGRVLLVTVRPHGDGTEIRVRIPKYNRGFNLALSGFTSGAFGLVAGGAGGGIAVTLGATAAIAALPVTVGALAGGALGLSAFRKLYRWGSRYGARAATQLLNAVALEAEGRIGRLTP